MKQKIINIWNNYRWLALVLGAGIFLGWLFFHSPGNRVETGNETLATHGDHAHAEEAGTIWTCSMHPQIRQDKPGKCPICGMDLIPVASLEPGDTQTHPDEIQLSESAAKLADIQTYVVKTGTPENEIFLQGKVQADERRIAALTARFGGRIEKLFVSFTGEQVTRGQKLATIYSPELVTAQRELLEAASYKGTRPSIYQAARAKLRLWDLNEEQIDGIENAKEPKTKFDILSPISGTVTKRNIALGDYIKEGSALFEVTDLTHIWIMFDAYESDLPWIRRGDRVSYTVQSLPGLTFRGSVAYIDPFIDPSTRVAKVRVEQSNPNLALKPEMFVNGQLESAFAGRSLDILIPKSSILWTGKRSIVYVKVPQRDQPSFQYREIELGPESGNFYVVDKGLREGEEIAVNGVFKIDAAAQLEGKPSMMNPEGGQVATAHMQGSMDGSIDGSGEQMESMKSSGPESGNQPASAGQVPGNQSASTGQAPGKVTPAFKEQLQMVYSAYILMKNAFVKSDAEQVKAEAEKVQSKLQAVDMEGVTGDLHMKWMNLLGTLKTEILNIINTGDLAKQRVAFAAFNNAFYNTLELFGLQNGTVYYQYCPMANGDKGAFWLSEVNEIRNPYFGDEMLSCGETRETLEFK
jgi:Cu(I)/Ag(I) efflux system membrane fusion protein